MSDPLPHGQPAKESFCDMAFIAKLLGYLTPTAKQKEQNEREERARRLFAINFPLVYGGNVHSDN